MIIENTAFSAGIVIGALLLLAVAWVWIKKQIFGVGGSVMCFSGIALIGLTVWKTIQVDVSGGEITAKFEERVKQLDTGLANVNDRVNKVIDNNAAVSRDLASVATSVRANSQQFVALTNRLAQQRTVPANTLDSIRKAIIVPKIDPNTIDKRAVTLMKLKTR